MADARFDGLMESYLSGALSAEEEKELDAALRRSSETREIFLDIAEIHRLLVQELRSQEAAEGSVEGVMRAVVRVSGPRDPAGTARSVMRSLRRRARRRNAALAGKIAGLLTAAALLLFAGYALLGTRSGAPSPSARAESTREAPDEERLAREPAWPEDDVEPGTRFVAEPEEPRREPFVAAEVTREPPPAGVVEPVEVVREPEEMAEKEEEADTPAVEPREPSPEVSPILAGRVRRTTGSFLCRRVDEKEWSRTTGEAALSRGDWLDTRTSRLAVRLAKRGWLYLNSASCVEFGDSGVYIEKGEVYAELVPGRGRYEIRTPNGSAIALGTKFLVEHGVLGTTIAVVMGEVVCGSAEAEVTLTDGQELRILEGQPPGRPRQSDLLRRLYWVHGSLGPLVLAQHVFQEPITDLRVVEGWEVVQTGSSTVAFLGEEEWDDYRLEAVFKPLEQGARAGLVFRAPGTDWKGGYLWSVEAKKKKVRLCPCAKLLGRASEVWDTRPLPVGQWTHMAVDAYGKEIWLYRDDDVEKTIVADASALHGRPGICIEGRVELRFVKVTRIPPGARR